MQNSVAKLKALVSGISSYFSWLPLALAAIAGLVALIYKSKAEQAEAEALVSHTQDEDAPLVAKQAQDEVAIKQVDENIQAIMDERTKLRDQYLTDQQKADNWNKST